MKTLIIMRHAKAEVSHSAGDHSRELTARGRSDAKRVAHSMVDRTFNRSSSFLQPRPGQCKRPGSLQPFFRTLLRKLLRPELYLADVEELLNAVHGD